MILKCLSELIQTQYADIIEALISLDYKGVILLKNVTVIQVFKFSRGKCTFALNNIHYIATLYIVYNIALTSTTAKVNLNVLLSLHFNLYYSSIMIVF